jgi:hypothetical protein
MARLVRLAQAQGIGVTGAPVTRNREIGLAFQRTVLGSMQVPENTNRYPTPRRGGPYASVVPDGVVLAVRINPRGGLSLNLEGAFVEVADGCEDFLEVKARSCQLTLSTGRRQMAGFIDALSQRWPRRRSFIGAQPPRPALLLVTTLDTVVAQDVLSEAARHGVAIFQAVAWEAQGFIGVGLFAQKTSFADVPQQFSFPSQSLKLR